MFQCSLKMLRFVKLYQVPLSGASLAAETKFMLISMKFLIPSQSTLQHPYCHQMFFPNHWKFLSYHHMLLNLKKGDIAAWQNTTAENNSWQDTVADITLSLEKAGTGGSERKRNGQMAMVSVRVGLTETLGKNQYLHWTKNQPHLPDVAPFSEQIQVEEEWGLWRKKAWVSVKWSMSLLYSQW
jgi:hypothetical protein